VMFGVNMVNGTIATSVASNALTFAIKTLAGNDPSSGDPVWFVFRDAIAGKGDYSVIEVTAALSVTVPVSSTLGMSNVTPAKIWLAAVNDGGTVSLSVINCYAGGTIFPLAGWGIVTVTAFGGGANLAQVFYGAAAHTGVPFGVLGYATYETGSTLATAGTWSAVPTRLELLRPGVALPGAVVQSLYDPIAATFTSSNTYTPAATPPTTSVGVQAGSQAISPSSSAHLLRVRGQLLLGSTGTAAPNQTLFLTQDAGSTAIAAACFAASAAATVPSQGSVVYQALAGTLVSTAFKLWGASSTGTVNVNTAGAGSAFFGGNASSFILVEEIAT
jgi:hypothetical protein